MKNSLVSAVALMTMAVASLSMSAATASAQSSLTVRRTKYQMGYSKGYTQGYTSGVLSYSRALSLNGYYTGHAPFGYGLLGLVAAPFAASTGYAPLAAACSARYKSYDPASNTFKSYDGNRYYCL